MYVRRALVALAGTVALIAPSTPAFAALYTHSDASGDVVKETCDGSTSCSETLDPTMADGDITRVNIRHQAHRVLIRIKQRELVSGLESGHFVRILTNEGVQRLIFITAEAGSTRPHTLMLRMRDGHLVSCSGLWAGYDGVEDLVTVIVPRRCLSYPRWVRVGVLAGKSDSTGNIDWDDDMMLNGRLSDMFLPALSPRIRRG